MKSIIFLLVAAMMFPVSLSASETDIDMAESTPVQTSARTELPLLVESILATDDRHITLEFNQNIIRESVRVRISKQSDESNVRIESFSGAVDSNNITIRLTDTLDANTAYKMTIISAISENGIIIRDGADGLKEFVTPIELKRYEPIELNAPNNPNAVMIDDPTPTQDTVINATTTTTTPVVPSPQPSPSETAEELPLTGMNSLLFIIIAVWLAGVLLLRRKQS